MNNGKHNSLLEGKCWTENQQVQLNMHNSAFKKKTKNQKLPDRAAARSPACNKWTEESYPLQLRRHCSNPKPLLRLQETKPAKSAEVKEEKRNPNNKTTQKMEFNFSSNGVLQNWKINGK